jgi:transposase
MGQSYSLDLRARVVARVRAGHSRREAARHFGVSPSCAVKLVKRVDRTGVAEPAPQGRPRGSGKLAPHQASCRPQRLNGPAEYHDLRPQVLKRPRGVIQLILLTNPHRHSDPPSPAQAQAALQPHRLALVLRLQHPL